MAEPSRIVIVGGGVAGVEIATRLGRSLGRRGRAEVTLVDRSLSHVWKPMLHTFAAGTSRPDRQKVSLFAQAQASGFRFRPGSLATVDRSARRIALDPVEADDERTDRQPSVMAYDALVLALGSRANDFGTPGVAEHCMTVDDLVEAESFHTALRSHVLGGPEADAAFDVAIVGGGATGVELAAELKRAIDVLAGYGSAIIRRDLRLALIESGPRILSAFPTRVSEAAARALADLGVEVRVATMVTAADDGGFQLKDGSRVAAKLRVWAAGVKAPDVLGRIDGLERSRIGQLLVRPTLQTTLDDAIYAVGDCASLVDPGTSRPVPATAQAAHQEAGYLSAHLRAGLQGRPVPPFRYRELGAIVSLADYNGWGTLGRYTFGGGRLRGLSARLAHALLYRQHQFGLFGALRGSLAWLVDDLDRVLTPEVRLD